MSPYADWPLLDGYSFKTSGMVSPSTARLRLEDGAWFMNVSPGWLGRHEDSPCLSGRDFRPSDLSPERGDRQSRRSRRQIRSAIENPIGRSLRKGPPGYMRGQQFPDCGRGARMPAYRYLREPVLPVAYTPFNRLDNGGKAMGGTFVVRTSTPNPLALGSTAAPGSCAWAAGLDFRVSSLADSGGSDRIADHPRAAAGNAGIASSAGSRCCWPVSGCMACWTSPSFSGVAKSVFGWPWERRRRTWRAASRSVSFSMVVLGAAAGLALGMASVRYIETLLFDVKATRIGSAGPCRRSPFSAAATLAALPPVIHAVRIDPATLLRTE